jgi:hypothetical protein
MKPTRLLLAFALAGCATTGMPERIPAESPASPEAAAAPVRPVARALRDPDPLAWPPLPTATAGGHHHHHHGHHGHAPADKQPAATAVGAPASAPAPPSAPATPPAGHEHHGHQP